MAYRQSIIDWMISSLFLIEKLMKFVSTIIWYGGPNWVLYLKNMAEDAWGLQNNLKYCVITLIRSDFFFNILWFHQYPYNFFGISLLSLSIIFNVHRNPISHNILHWKILSLAMNEKYSLHYHFHEIHKKDAHIYKIKSH